MSKKLAGLVVLVILICFILSACASKNLIKNESYNNVDLDKHQIEEISISASPKRFQELNITDSEQISMIVDYFTSINLNTTELNYEDYYGSGYLINIKLKNNVEKEFLHYGNMFFIELGNTTFEMPYEDAIKFDTIVASILESTQEKTGEPSIIGTIINVNSEPSGRNISCVIKDEDNITHTINLEKASIVDSTGNGWLILHDNDKVKIYYQKENILEDGSLIASTVFIQKSSS